MKQVNVTVWSDFVCPWCWIAKRRLERAAKSLEQQVAVVFDYKSYRLGRGTSPMDYRKAIAMKLGNSQAAAQLIEAVSAQAGMEGLTYNFEGMQFGDTTLSLIKTR